MDYLFKEYCFYEEYKNILFGPLEADCKSVNGGYCHYQKCYFINFNTIKHVNKCMLIKDKIECLYFVYIDFGEKQWDDKYWFFVGKLTNDLYFAYESDCCGTGFGLGSSSSLYLSKTPELLYTYGLTNKHRDLINSNINISQRFNCLNAGNKTY